MTDRFVYLTQDIIDRAVEIVVIAGHPEEMACVRKNNSHFGAFQILLEAVLEQQHQAQEHQAREKRYKQYLKLKSEFEPNTGANAKQ